ncbi:MAG: alpha/beta hydrolase [Cytophagales bacterium]|nr:alpha/beta hydrolase [Cytophagales bacterium]
MFLVLSALLVWAGISFPKVKENAGEKFKSGAFSSSFGTLHYKVAGEKSCPVFLMIHGSPGSWKAMRVFLEDSELTSRFRVVAIDRPGYGKSFLAQDEKNSLKSQLRLIGAFTDSLQNGKPFYLLGHSYGGALAVGLLAEKNYMSGAVLVAPTLSPEIQKKRFYNYFAAALKPVMPKEIKKSNEEMWVLSDELKKIEPQLRQINVPVRLIHGKKDWLVPYRTVQYCEERIPGECLQVITVPKGGHFILWEQHQLVAEEMMSLAEEEQKKL